MKVTRIVLGLTMLLSQTLIPAQAQSQPTYAAQTAWTLHLMEAGRYLEAVDAVQLLVSLDPNAAVSYQMRGTLALRVGNVSRAVNDFHVAATRAPGNPTTTLGLADCALFSHQASAANKYANSLRQSRRLTESQVADTACLGAYLSFLQGNNSGAEALLTEAGTESLAGEIRALTAARAHAPDTTTRLTNYLTTANGVPRVVEEDGLRARFEPSVWVEPAVTSPALRRMYAAKMTDRMAATARRVGKPAQTVSGVLNLQLSVPNGLPVSVVSFKVDGQSASLVSGRPYSFAWDTRQAANGTHVIQMEALDAAEQTLLTQTRTVRVRNAGRAAGYDAQGNLDSAAFAQAEQRVWNLLRLHPARKVAEWTLANILAHQGDSAGAQLHREIAAALDPDYQNARAFAKSLYRGSAPLMARLDGFWLGSPQGNQIALTFDDGPTAAHTLTLLDALEKTQTPATFFIVGARAAENPDLVRRMAARGDAIENHSYTHPNMTQAITSDAEGEILRTNIVIRLLTGKQPRFFRPPGGNADPQVLQIARNYGLATAFWTIDAINAEEDGFPKALVAYVLKKARPGAIVLLHNGSATTAAALPALVSALRSRGFHLVTLTQLAALPAPPVPLASVKRHE